MMFDVCNYNVAEFIEKDDKNDIFNTDKKCYYK